MSDVPTDWLTALEEYRSASLAFEAACAADDAEYKRHEAAAKELEEARPKTATRLGTARKALDACLGLRR